ncbi:MAG TPA: hypothetical protein VD928_03275 [Candidatus Paceibacterota bacterium]|nr:hypothetical protein [Candidatus Paceibacterota bacterium]
MVEIGQNERKEIAVPHFDSHVHGRRIPVMNHVLPLAAQRMCGGILEPNTNPHLQTYDDVAVYLEQAHTIAPNRTWLGSLYLTPHTNEKEVLRCWEEGLISHVKWYPPHGSTHSGESVAPEILLEKDSPTGKLFSMMAESGIPLKNHGEVVSWQGKEIHPERREGVYFREIQPRIQDTYPGLRQILAHISTRDAVYYMDKHGDPYNRICEITPHHLAFDGRILYDGGFILPDHHCLPVVKTMTRHNHALQALIKSRPQYVVAGSDMAAHPTENKYAFRAFGGFFTYHCSLELYVQLLGELGVLNYANDFLFGNLERFHHGRVPDNPKKIRLTNESWTVDTRIGSPSLTFTPFGYHDEPSKRFQFRWRIVE